jgi:hypothetical protein
MTFAVGLRPGNRLAFELEGDSVRLKVERRKEFKELNGILRSGREYPGREAEREAARDHVAREALGERPSS